MSQAILFKKTLRESMNTLYPDEYLEDTNMYYLKPFLESVS